jgi:hypothetical protein
VGGVFTFVLVLRGNLGFTSDRLAMTLGFEIFAVVVLIQVDGFAT